MISTAATQAGENDAKELFARAESQFSAGEYKKALTLYQQAFQRQSLPGFHFNMGQCHRQLGQFEQAIDQFRQYLDQPKKPKHWEEAEALIRDCERDLQQTGDVERPADLNSPRTGKDPAQVPSIAPVPGPSGSENRSDKRRRFRPVFFWAGVGLTGALVVTGTITGALALGKSSSYNDPATPREELLGLKDAGESLKTASTVTFIMALAAAAGTAALFFYTDFGQREQRLTAAPMPGGGAIFWRGQF